MSKCNYIDFDDQIHFACDILDNFPDILDKYQTRAEHLLVDEYQDINAAQFRLIELLSRKNPYGLFVVGDDLRYDLVDLVISQEVFDLSGVKTVTLFITLYQCKMFSHKGNVAIISRFLLNDRAKKGYLFISTFQDIH